MKHDLKLTGEEEERLIFKDKKVRTAQCHPIDLKLTVLSVAMFIVKYLVGLLQTGFGVNGQCWVKPREYPFKFNPVMPRVSYLIHAFFCEFSPKNLNKLHNTF